MRKWSFFSDDFFRDQPVEIPFFSLTEPVMNRTIRDEYLSPGQQYRSLNGGERPKRKSSEVDSAKKHSRKSGSRMRKSEFDDARLFCDDCQEYHENICPHHQQMYIPDKKVMIFLIREFYPMMVVRYPSQLWKRTSNGRIWHVRMESSLEHRLSLGRAKASSQRVVSKRIPISVRTQAHVIPISPRHKSQVMHGA